MTEPDDMAEGIRIAYDTGDLTGFGDLLADDVRWGSDDHPHRCRSREDVLQTFSGWLGQGVTATVREARAGSFGVAIRLHVDWTDPTDRARGTEFFHVLLLRDGAIAEIRRFDDVRSAHAAISG